jgi:CheY-like chemotaxis protein
MSARAWLATLRHDLRTPLNAIIGYSELLLEDLADDAAVADLRQIRTAGGLLLARVNDLLDAARYDTGDTTPNRATIAATLQHELRTPITAVIGYTEMLLEDQDDKSIIADLDKIHAAATRLLALVDDVVHRSVLGTGELSHGGAPAPTASEEATTAIRSLEARDRTTTSLAGAILVVDDNEINRDVLGRQLERQGHRVTPAAGGQEALDLAHSRPFDLVLLDVMMPGMNGYEVLGHLKTDKATRDLPVIMVSALEELDSVVRCIELGAEDYLPKPCDPTLLRARVGACLEKKRLRDQEVAYLQSVAQVIQAAGAVESGQFAPASLAEVAARPDALGQLARVFERMAGEVISREQRLRQEVQQLRIEIDEARAARQVAEITDNDFFRDLAARAQQMRGGTRRAGQSG